MKSLYKKIMVIDDNHKNLKLLGNMLEEQGYDIYSFDSGEAAYRAAERSKPDLILMDICMPQINGYDLCKMFKQNEELKDIPIIFLSALDSINDKIQAFQNGGVDYITKPFYAEEVEARIKTHLKIIEMQHRLENENENLENIVEERTKELREAYYRLKESDKIKGEILNKASAEIKGPWNNILKVFESVFTNTDEEEYQEIERSKNKLEDLINDTEILNKIEFYEEKPTLEKVSVLKIIREIEKSGLEIEIEKEYEIKDKYINGNMELIKRALEILIEVVQSYKREKKVKLVCKSKAEYIYLSFMLDDFFIYNEDITEFLSMKYNNKEAGNTISNILAHKIITIFHGEIVVEKIGKNIAALTIILNKFGDGIGEEACNSR